MNKPQSLSHYISLAEKIAQPHLKKMRATIKKAAPKSKETFKWNMPTFIFNEKNLVHFCEFKAHLGFFPGGDAIKAFKKETVDYKTSKGTIQFPYDQPIPAKLITRIVKYNLSAIKNEK